MSDTPMEREPVRAAVLASALAAGVIGLAVDLLMGGAWRVAVAGFLTTIPPVLLGAEVARGRAWSPSAVWLATVQARRDAAPPVERPPEGSPFPFPFSPPS